MGIVVIGEQAIPCDDRRRLNSMDEKLLIVHISPMTSGVTIRGFLSDDTIGSVEVGGGRTDVQLQFCQPELYIEYHPGLESFRIGQGERMKPLTKF